MVADDVAERVEKKLQEEYNRCLAFWQDPTGAPSLFGIHGPAEMKLYFEHRTETLGFVLDLFDQARRNEI